MPSYYEINVTLDGKHFFATASRSITCKEDAETLWASFKTRFPASDGFEMSLTYYESFGHFCKFVDGKIVH